MWTRIQDFDCFPIQLIVDFTISLLQVARDKILKNGIQQPLSDYLFLNDIKIKSWTWLQLIISVEARVRSQI